MLFDGPMTFTLYELSTGRVVYKQFEGTCDSVIDFKLDETGEETRDLIRIRNMRNVSFDRRWHALGIGENF